MTFPILTSEDVISGRWQVIRRIDSGGAAAVYAVRELGGERTLAVKVVHKRDKGNAKRVKAEYETLFCLDHPNVIHVYEWGEDKEKCYYFMDLIDGGPLREVIQAGLLTLVQSLHLYRQILHAVAYLHENDVVHRDLKPGNILVDSNLHPTLIDLGACRSPLREEITIKEDCTGTPSFMSPEQAAVCVGNREPDVRLIADSKQADIYALGILLYHLLAGQSPHGKPGKSPAELEAFYHRRATEKPEKVEFPDEALGQLAMVMLLPANGGRPSSLVGVISAFEAAFADMRDDSREVLSPLCNQERARLLKLADAEMERRDEAGEEFVTPDVSDIHAAAEGVRKKLAGLGLLGAAGAMGGLVVLLGAALILGLGQDGATGNGAAQVSDSVPAVRVHEDARDGASVWAGIPMPAELATNVHDDVLGFLLNVSVISGPVPGQKRYPCNKAKKEVPWKGGCWLIFAVPGGGVGSTKEEVAEGCRTSPLYEPEPGWCIKSRGMVYNPVSAAADVKPPPTAYGPDSPDVVKDSNGYKAAGGSGQ